VKLKDITEYIKQVETELFNDQLFEMANVTSRYHGIDGVVIWVGLAPGQHGLRVKISKVPNKMDIHNSFVVMMPSLDYDEKQVPNWINAQTMNKILEWIKLNQKLLNDYENGLIHDTGYFLDNISKV